MNRPIFDENLVRRFEYKIAVVRYVDGSPNKTFDRLVIHPIEAGNRLEFRSENDPAASFSIPIDTVTEISTPEQAEGEPEKQDLLLEIEFKDEHGSKKSIAFNVQDRHIEEALVRTLKPMEQKYWDAVELEYVLGGVTKTTQLYYKTPFLSDGEELLWVNTKTEGTSTKHIRWLEALTNFRAIYYDFGKHDSGRIPLNLVDDVVVRNQRAASASSRFGTFTSRGSAALAETGTNQDGMTIGDVHFIREGKSIVTFVQVSDPHRLAGLAKATIKQLFPKSGRVRLPLVEGPVAEVQTSTTGEPVCPYCGTANQPAAKFCSVCGFAFR
jgi:hypothetical protein